MTKKMGSGCLSKLTGKNTSVIGRMVYSMASEYLLIRVALNTKGNGVRANCSTGSRRYQVQCL
jgi:hypothetical protein